MIDWRFIVAKHILKRKWEFGFAWDWDSFIDHSEDFNRDIILSRGELFIDAGANIGFWTIPASTYYERVVAIEPTVETLRILRKNIRMNRIGNVTVIPKALSDSVGIASFYRWGNPLGNGLLRTPINYTSDYAQAVEDGTVETVTIDSLSLEPSCIKLDVEGVEDGAVRGGLSTIRRCHPVLVIEIHRRENEEKIQEMLPEYNWIKRVRHMKMEGTSEFDQTHLVGKYPQ